MYVKKKNFKLNCNFHKNAANLHEEIMAIAREEEFGLEHLGIGYFSRSFKY